MAVKLQIKTNQLAKDLELKNKDITDIMSEKGFDAKGQKALTSHEFDVIFNTITKRNQIQGIDDYIDGVTYIPSKLNKAPEKKAAEEVLVETAPATVAEPAAKPKAEPKSEPKAEPEKKAAPAKKAEPKPEVKAEPKPEVKAEVKPEVKAEPEKKQNTVDRAAAIARAAAIEKAAREKAQARGNAESKQTDTQRTASLSLTETLRDPLPSPPTQDPMQDRVAIADSTRSVPSVPHPQVATINSIDSQRLPRSALPRPTDATTESLSRSLTTREAAWEWVWTRTITYRPLPRRSSSPSTSFVSRHPRVATAHRRRARLVSLI